MKSCNEISEMLALYIDEELDHETRIMCEDHINSCERCKNELYEMKQIIGLCNSIDEEELPDRFTIELREKLIQVRDQEGRQQKFAVLRNRYLKICSSIAAVLVMTVLIKGLWGGILSNTNKSAEDSNYSTQAELTTAQSELQQQDTGITDNFDASMADRNAFTKESPDTSAKKAAEPKEEADTQNKEMARVMTERSGEQATVTTAGDTVPKEDTDPSKGVTSNSGAGNTENTTGDKGNGEDSVMFSKALEGNETALAAKAPSPTDPDTNETGTEPVHIYGAANRNIPVTIKSDQPEAEIEKIKKLAADNGAEYSESAGDTYMAIAATSEAVTTSESTANQTVLRFNISNAQSGQFVESLKINYPGAQIEVGRVNAEAAELTMDELGKKLVDTNNRIAELKKYEGDVDEAELERLRLERNNIIQELDRVRREDEYTMVVLTIIKK